MKISRDHILILLIGVILFVPFLGASPLFDWDEVNFAEASREMILTGNYTQTQIDFQPFWEKPPLFFWLQAASMKVFGINEFAARFPNAVCGIITLLVLFSIGKQLKDQRLGWLWVLAYAGSILPHFYFKSGIIDPWFNLFIFLALYYFIRYSGNSFYLRYLFYSGILLGLAVLTKGPVAGLIAGLVILIYFIIQRFRFFPPLKHILLYFVFIALPIIPWITIEIINNGTWFIGEFLKYQLRLATTEDASHGGFFGYHFIIIFFFCFPASAFAVRSLIKSQDDDQVILNFRRWMLILFWVVMIVFSIVQTKIIHYSSLAYFPLTFLAAYGLYSLKTQWRKLENALLIITGVIFSSLVALVPIVIQLPGLKLLVNDEFTRMALNTEGGWNGYEFLLSLIMLSGLIVSFVLNYKNQLQKAVTILFISSMITINLVLNIFTPHIARYSQGSLLDFFKAAQEKDCYTDVVGYKSYIQLFYGERMETDIKNPRYLSWLKNAHPDFDGDPIYYRKYYSEWLLNGNIDKPVYFATTVRKKNMFDPLPQLQHLYEKNGYVFYKRDPQ
ncbi:MAG: ArnT family glycosyltransferase [Chitinophagales bacterium]